MNKSENVRGIYTQNNIASNQIILSVPIRCCLFEETMKMHPINIETRTFDALLQESSDIALAFYLSELKTQMQFKFATNYYFSPYIDSLPNNPPNTPFFWKSDFIKLIKHTQAYRHILNQHKHIQKISKNLKISFGSNFFWGFSMINSRMWRLKIHNQTVPILVPIADLLNHDPLRASVSLKYNPETETIDISTFAKINANSEIYLSYGPKSNSILLAQYGFILSNNPYSVSEFDLFLSPNDDNFEAKRALLNRLRLNKLRFDEYGLDLESAKTFWIASLSKEVFDSHCISKILAVSKKDGYRMDEIHRIGQRMQMKKMESRLRESLCGTFLRMSELSKEQINDGMLMKEAMCMDDTNKVHDLLDMIIDYLKLEDRNLQHNKLIYCN